MNKKATYLIVSEVFYPEEFLVNDLVFELGKQGESVEVLTHTPSYPYGKVFGGYKNKLFQRNKYDDIVVNRVSIVQGYASSKIRKILNYCWFVLSTTWFMLRNGGKYDAYLVYQTGPLTVAVSCVIGKIFWKKRLIVYTQDVWPDTVFAYGFRKRRLTVKLLDIFVKWVYSHSDAILVSCEGFKSKIERYSDNKEIVYVPNWVPASFESDSGTIEWKYDGELNFTFAGNVGKVQNLENVIEGFAVFRKNTPLVPARLHIIGDGSNLQSLKSLVTRKNIPDVIFWGRRPMRDMPSFFAKSKALIISLIDEPIFSLTVPSKFQAYMVARKPYFCVMNGEVADLVTKHQLGIVSAPSNIEDIAEGFMKLAKLESEDYAFYSDKIQAIEKKDFDRRNNINRIKSKLLGL